MRSFSHCQNNSNEYHKSVVVSSDIKKIIQMILLLRISRANQIKGCLLKYESWPGMSECKIYEIFWQEFIFINYVSQLFFIFVQIRTWIWLQMAIKGLKFHLFIQLKHFSHFSEVCTVGSFIPQLNKGDCALRGNSGAVFEEHNLYVQKALQYWSCSIQMLFFWTAHDQSP